MEYFTELSGTLGLFKEVYFIFYLSIWEGAGGRRSGKGERKEMLNYRIQRYVNKLSCERIYCGVRESPLRYLNISNSCSLPPSPPPPFLEATITHYFRFVHRFLNGRDYWKL